MAQPMIIPGKNRPAGTFVPYVVIVSKYQMIKNVMIPPNSVSTLWPMMFLIICDSEAHRRVAIGL